MVSLSVVIPAYNVEAYLPLCLDSLFSTSGIETTEILVIDDGSTDNTRKIADEYAGKYNNLRVIHKDNEGPSAARNRGINEASGKYVFFCDSDDSVVPELFSKVLDIVQDCSDDIILWDSELKYETVNLLVPKNRAFFAHGGLEKIEKTYGGKQILEVQLRNSGDFVATVWLGAYRREFLINNDLYFEEGLIHEDELWAPKVFINAQSVHYIPSKLYVYRIHEGSIMNPGTKDRAESSKALMYVYPSLYKYYDEVLSGKPLKVLIEGNLTKRYIHMIYKYRIWRYGYGKQIDRKLLWRTSLRLRDKVMVLLLYLFVH